MHVWKSENLVIGTSRLEKLLSYNYTPCERRWDKEKDIEKEIVTRLYASKKKLTTVSMTIAIASLCMYAPI